MLIGLEIELHSNNYYDEEILRDNGLSYELFKDVGLKNGILIKMSREYYNRTIEYNFTPFQPTEENFLIVREFIIAQIERYNLSIFGDRPAFVGTHIHFFNDKGMLDNTLEFLPYTAEFILKNKKRLHKYGVGRLLLGHQLWANWSYNNEKVWNELVGHDYHKSADEKSKYNPIIYSPQTNSGKPESMEVRLIPNEFIFVPGLLEEFCYGIKRSLSNFSMSYFFETLVPIFKGRNKEEGDFIYPNKKKKKNDNDYAGNSPDMIFLDEIPSEFGPF